VKLLKRVEVLNKRLWKPVLGSLFRNRPSSGKVDPAGVRNILILRLDRFGDMVVSTPLFRALKRNMPRANIGVFGGPENVSVIENDTNVTWIYRRTRNPLRTIVEALRARKEGFDVCLNLNLNPSLTGSIIANVAAPSAVKVMGADEPSTRAFYNMSLNIDRDLRTPMVDQVLKYLEAFGLSPDGEDRGPYLSLAGTSPEKVDRFLEKEGLLEEGFSILNPFAGDSRREPGESLAVEVAKQVREATGDPIVILRAPGRDREVRAITEGTGDVRVVSGPRGCSILETAMLLSRCRFVISPDTSIVHIADAVRKPVVVIYSELVPSFREWYPQSVPYRSLCAEVQVSDLTAAAITSAALDLVSELEQTGN